MYKLLISDFEDVLIDIEDAIPLSTMLELDRIRNAKKAFGVITKKSFKSVLDYNKDFPFVDFIIALDGAYVYDVNKEKAIVKKNISISIVKKINKVFQDYNICYYTLDWCNYTKEKVDYEFARKISDFKVFSDFHRDNIFKIEIHCANKGEQKAILSKLEELNLDVTFMPKSNGKYFVEIIMSECSRFQAITKICKAKRIMLRNVLMIGADDEDMESFQKVGFSVATYNASFKLRKKSKEVSQCKDEKLVENVIKKYM